MHITKNPTKATDFHLRDLVNILFDHLYHTGAKQDHIGAREFILQIYLKTNPDPDRTCYSHFTTATGPFILTRRFG